MDKSNWTSLGDMEGDFAVSSAFKPDPLKRVRAYGEAVGLHGSKQCEVL
jgi:hypothetical protein